MNSFSDDVIACADLVREHDPVRFRTIMASPVAMRRLMFPLFAFNIEMPRAAWASKETMIAEMRLQWWYDALEEIAQGGVIRRHYVITPLALAITSEQARCLQTSVEARRWDIYSDPFDSTDQMLQYVTNTTAPLLQIAAQTTDKKIERLACAIGVANFLRAIPNLLAHGKRPLYDGRPDAIRTLASDAQKCLNKTRLSSDERHAVLSGYQTRHYLSQAINYPDLVATGLIAPSPLKDQYLFHRARLWSL